MNKAETLFYRGAKQKVDSRRSKQRPTQKRRQKTGGRPRASGGGGGGMGVQTSGIRICKEAEGGANSASTGRVGDGQQRKNMRWREQRQ